MGSKFGARTAGVQADLTMGGLDITMITKEVDIYLRAGQIPKVVVRPNLERLEADLDGASIVIAPEVAVMLEDMGWIPPETAGPLKDALSAARFQHAGCADAVVTLEMERDHYRDRIGTLEEALTDARGRLEDLEMANRALHDELEAAQRETAHRLPYSA